MSRIARLVLIGAIHALGAGSAAAQDGRALQERITRLERALVRAEADLRRIDSLEPGRLEPIEDVRVGALLVAAPRSVVPAARAAAERVWPLLDATFGSAAARLADHRFPLVLMRGAALPRRAGADAVLTTGTESDIAQRLLWNVATAIGDWSDPALRAWMGGALVPEADATREPRGVYLALVTAPSPAVRRCFEGDLGACRIALGFVPTADAITEWYDAERRRTIVAEIDNVDPVQSMRTAARACVEQGSDSDCLAILRLVPPAAVPPPLPVAARLSIVRYALARGGRDAYARLLASADRHAIEPRLAAASGLPGDSLLAGWRAGIVAARPRHVTVEPRGAWMALAWTVAFGLLALRSSRWR